MTDTPTTTDAPTNDDAAKAPTPADMPSKNPTTPTGTDWQAEATKWEARAKANASAAKKLAALEDANKTETEKLTDRATSAEKAAHEWQTKYQTLITRQAITQAAADAGSTDTETVYLYLRDSVEVDENGNLQGLDKAIKELAARKPHLFRDTPAGARDAFNTSRPAPALNSDALADALRAAVGL